MEAETITLPRSLFVKKKKNMKGCFVLVFPFIFFKFNYN